MCEEEKEQVEHCVQQEANEQINNPVTDEKTKTQILSEYIDFGPNPSFDHWPLTDENISQGGYNEGFY